jgi:Bacterial EndoU nuclease
VLGTGAAVVMYLHDARTRYFHDLDASVEVLSPDLEAALQAAAVSPQPDSGRIADPTRIGVQLPDVAEVAAAGLTGTAWDAVTGKHPTPDSIRIVAKRINHILEGDKSGGGHRHGRGIAGKTEFPAAWSDSTIIGAVLAVARRPDRIGPVDEHKRVLRGVIDGVRMEVVVDDGGNVVTGYPTGGPGVITNPP